MELRSGNAAGGWTTDPPLPSGSCLIAMALKNSKTGSLPVSEIYGFMKEHFPYFKVRKAEHNGVQESSPSAEAQRPTVGRWADRWKDVCAGEVLAVKSPPLKNGEGLH